MIEEPSMFDKYGVGWFYKKTNRAVYVARKYFPTREEADKFYYENLKHNHDKTLFKLPDENDKDYYVLESDKI